MEVIGEILSIKGSLAFDEFENRMYVIKALYLPVLGEP